MDVVVSTMGNPLTRMRPVAGLATGACIRNSTTGDEVTNSTVKGQYAAWLEPPGFRSDITYAAVLPAKAMPEGRPGYRNRVEPVRSRPVVAACVPPTAVSAAPMRFSRCHPAEPAIVDAALAPTAAKLTVG